MRAGREGKRGAAMRVTAPLLASDVKARADFVGIASRYMAVRRSGRQWCGLCPFHAERHPSFYLHPQRKVFFCFGCGAFGDLFDFVMRAEGCDFPAAVRLVNGFPGGASEGRPVFGWPERAGAKPPAFRRKAHVHSWKERSFSPANRWPSVEDCAAERVLFTCQKTDNSPTSPTWGRA